MGTENCLCISSYPWISICINKLFSLSLQSAIIIVIPEPNFECDIKCLSEFIESIIRVYKDVYLFGKFNSNSITLNPFACIGNVNKNGLYFDHFKLDDLKITANGLRVMEFELNFPNKYTSLYTRIIDSMNSDRHLISHSKFGSGMTIITADCKDSENNLFMQIEKHGYLEIHERFSVPMPEPINVIIIGVTSGSIEVDYDGRVSTHYP